MQTLFFGTYDERSHPRVQVLREGLEATGLDVTVLNEPLGIGTAGRVDAARSPLSAVSLLGRVAQRWVRLWRGGRGLHPEVVVVGYLGHLDVHLARWRFRQAIVVLDHMVGLGDTARDRRLPKLVVTLLDRVDRAALRAAHVVVVDTQEQGEQLPAAVADRCVVVPVGAPEAWFTARSPDPAEDLRVIFFGLFTPLHGAPTIGEAIASLVGRPLAVTIVGVGQDKSAVDALLADDPRVTWLDWVDGAELPALVAQHDICLGIFGTSEKAQRVVPNKVYQGAAAGCAVITSDTPPQRRVLGDGATLVPPGDAAALARAISALEADRSALRGRQDAARRLADERFRPIEVVRPLVQRLGVGPRT